MNHLIKSLAALVLSVAASWAVAAVDVNKASQAELESVKGIGPAMSGRILDARKTASFADWHDLQSRVKGLGDAKALKLSGDGLTVNGGAFKAVSLTPDEPKKPKGSRKAAEPAPQKEAPAKPRMPKA